MKSTTELLRILMGLRGKSQAKVCSFCDATAAADAVRDDYMAR